MDGQTEKVNSVIQQFQRNYVAMDQQDWVDHFELVEFYYNNSKHSTINSTPFQMVMGKSPIVPMTWATLRLPPSDANEEVSMVMQFDEERQLFCEMAKANLQKAHKRYKDFVDKSQQEVNFEKRDEVWLNIKKIQLPKGLSHKFLGPYASPLKMLEKKFPEIYKLNYQKP